MARISNEKILAVLAPMVIAGLAILFTFPLTWALTLLVAYYILLFVLPYLNDRNYEDDMSKGWVYVRQWWLERRHEDLGMVYSQGFGRYFGNTEQDLYLAFRVIRGANSPTKPYMPLVFVVKMYPRPKIMDWDDTLKSTSDDKWANPFKDIAVRFTGSPSPNLRPELETELHRRYRKPEPDREEKEEKDEKDEVSDIDEG